MADPRLILGPDGSRLQFTGGQPLLDHGLENLVLISLFTAQQWIGNRFMATPVGSDFEETCNQPITRQSLNLIRQAAERALALTVLGKVTVVVTNPNGYRIDVQIGSVCLTRNNGNWSFQTTDPAYRKVIN